MSSRTPPLGALRCFRAAAHCLSFTIAAEELHVTQAAVSHQIKSLETFLNVSLFVRGNRSLALSESGERFIPYVDQMFNVLDQGLAQMVDASTPDTLTVSLLPSFASRWLVPRLGLFLKAHPDIDFRLAPSRGMTNFQDEDIDLAIRYGSGTYPGLVSIHLMDEDIFPVCSPSIMESAHPLRKPERWRYSLLLKAMVSHWHAVS